MRAIVTIITSVCGLAPAGYGLCHGAPSREVVVERSCAPRFERVVCEPVRRVEYVSEICRPAPVTRVVVAPRFCPPRPRCLPRIRVVYDRCR